MGSLLFRSSIACVKKALLKPRAYPMRFGIPLSFAMSAERKLFGRSRIESPFICFRAYTLGKTFFVLIGKIASTSATPSRSSIKWGRTASVILAFGYALRAALQTQLAITTSPTQEGQRMMSDLVSSSRDMSVLLYSTLVRKAVFLDRDGTIITNEGDLGDPNGVELIEGAKEAIKLLHKAGWLLIVVTNQAGVARGAFTEDDIELVHNRIDELVSIDGVSPIEQYYYCCYHPEGPAPEWTCDHPSRKPRPGMLREAMLKHDIDGTRSWMIGDTARDIQAGNAAKCKTVWLSGQNRVTDETTPTLFAPQLIDAAKFILAEERTH